MCSVVHLALESCPTESVVNQECRLNWEKPRDAKVQIGVKILKTVVIDGQSSG